MKKHLKIFWLITGLLIISSYGYCKFPKEKKMANSTNGKAIVELFTSEGCSSCPAADKVMAAIEDEYKGQVYVLGFHVDYWDHLGWKDTYSDKAWSERQRNYAEVFKTESVYTPQAVVNGKTEMVGSDDSKLHTVINKYLAEKPGNDLQITAGATGKTITVQYNIAQTKGQLLNIALVQKHALTDVKRGENEGRKLSHVNIVRDLKTINLTDTKGSVTIPLPNDMSAAQCKVVAFAQLKSNMSVTASTDTDIK